MRVSIKINSVAYETQILKNRGRSRYCWRGHAVPPTADEKDMQVWMIYDETTPRGSMELFQFCFGQVLDFEISGFSSRYEAGVFKVVRASGRLLTSYPTKVAENKG